MLYSHRASHERNRGTEALQTRRLRLRPEATHANSEEGLARVPAPFSEAREGARRMRRPDRVVRLQCGGSTSSAVPADHEFVGPQRSLLDPRTAGDSSDEQLVRANCVISLAQCKSMLLR